MGVWLIPLCGSNNIRRLLNHKAADLVDVGQKLKDFCLIGIVRECNNARCQLR